MDDTQTDVTQEETAATEAAVTQPGMETPPEGRQSKSKTASKEAKQTALSVASDNPKINEIIETIKGITALELAALVKALETTFGVSAAAPTAAPSSSKSEDPEGPAEEQTTFNVVLATAGANKIAVIKAVRELVPTLGLKEAKDLVEAAPKEVLTGINRQTAEEAKTRLTTAGATVEIK